MAVSKKNLIEMRLATLEAEVARLKQQTEASELQWWEQRWGVFDNDPDYDKAMELGRKYRESLRSRPARKAARKKAASKPVKAGRR
jgi:hypothetical protein